MNERKAEATATGTAGGTLKLPFGRKYRLSFVSAGAFTLDLQELSGDGAKWSDSFDDAGKVSINSASGRQTVVAVSGTYRMNVLTYASKITMYAEDLE